MDIRSNGFGLSGFTVRLAVLTALATLSSTHATAAVEPGDRELQQQLQRQQQLEQTLQPDVPDVRLQPRLEPLPESFPEEHPCFVIDEIKLSGADSLPSQRRARLILNDATGRCLGVQGIQLIMTRLQNLWVAQGLVTTRVLAPPQELASGTLELIAVPGVLRSLTSPAVDKVNLQSAIPATEGEILNLRDIEQGLENLQRLPTVTAGFKILPGEQPGESDIAVDWQQSKKWRLALAANDAGSRATGRNQGTATLYLDNALGLSDLFYLSYGSDLQRGSALGTDSYTGHYSLPLGYWDLGLTASGYDYHQTIAGSSRNVEYSGKSSTQRFDLGRVIQRSSHSKTSLSLAFAHRKSRNYIEDVEVELQRRETAYWELALSNRYFFDSSTLNSTLAYRKGIRAFGADPAPEESTGDATALSSILFLDLSLSAPFRLGEQRLRWSSALSGQWTDTPLTPQEQFTIGGRYTVRGFDGQVSLAADRGWYIRNDLAWLIPGSNQELYVGLDYGKVSGEGSEFLPGRSLTGTVLGVKGNWKGVSYRLFAGRPVSKPDGFKTDRHTYGFSLNWEI